MIYTTKLDIFSLWNSLTKKNNFFTNLFSVGIVRLRGDSEISTGSRTRILKYDLFLVVHHCTRCRSAKSANIAGRKFSKKDNVCQNNLYMVERL